MKRLTEYTIPETGFTVVPEEKYKRILMDEKPSVEKVYNRLKKIEDILGDEYDLDHLKELVQADREQMYMEPGFHINIQNGNDCFQSWWLRNRESTKEREQDG